jgi:hypothetical protein
LLVNLPHFGAVTIFDEDHEPHRFELRLSEPPVLSTIASFDGRMESATLSDGDYYIVVHVSPNTDVSSIIQAIQEVIPNRRSSRSGTRLAPTVRLRA